MCLPKIKKKWWTEIKLLINKFKFMDPKTPKRRIANVIVTDGVHNPIWNGDKPQLAGVCRIPRMHQSGF